jgi:4'-phosphopantetheinyl transferase
MDMKEKIKWNFPYGNVALDKNEVHLWRAKLNFTSRQVTKFTSFLSDDEKQKAFSFYSKTDTHNYIASRAITRLIISRYTNLEPAEIVFYYNYFGKPFVLTNNFGFNISHSKDFVICAVSGSKMVGIDIEFIKDGFNSLEIAERFFSKAEIDELKSVPFNLRNEAFFNCWTRKEAFIKARGIGLSLPLDSFDVSLMPGKPARILSIRNNDEGSQNYWHFQNLNVAKGYASALVLPYEPHAVRYWDWNYTIEIVDRYAKPLHTIIEGQTNLINDKLMV